MNFLLKSKEHGMIKSGKLNKAEDAAIKKDVLLPLDMRPPKELSFNRDCVKEIISNILKEELSGKTYRSNEADELCSQIKTKLRTKVRASVHENYKIVAHIILGEQREAGIRVVARCLWDSENDKIATALFENETIFCVASIFAMYFY